MRAESTWCEQIAIQIRTNSGEVNRLAADWDTIVAASLITEQIAGSELATLAVSAVPYVYRTDQSDSPSCQSVARKTTNVPEQINLAVPV